MENIQKKIREIELFHFTSFWTGFFLAMFYKYSHRNFPASGFTGTGMSGVQFGDSSGMPPGVKVVKLSATTSGIANARTVYSPQVSDILRTKSFTSFKADLHKYINEGFALIRCFNVTFA